MKIDKKSLIQIVVLVVLVIGGAAAYLMQQDGGLDFIGDLFESEPATIRTPAASRPQAPADKPATVPSVAKPKPAAAEIPATPAKGEVHGKSFVVESSSIENGLLVLKMGKDAVADLEVKVMLPDVSWETPAGKKYKVAETGGAGIPQVTLAWRDDGQSTPSEQKFADKYTLTLEFGQEKDKKLPGKIQINLPDEKKSHVAGTFEADIRGFRIVDGKPDLSADSVDTFQYLALRELLKDDPNKSLEVTSFRDGRYAQPESAGKNMSGYIEVQYRIGQDYLGLQRYQFEKDGGAWKVARALKGNQLDEAHPLHVPGAKDSPSKMLTYLAAKKLEADIQKKHPGKNIHRPEFMSRHSDKFKVGVCEVSYRFDVSGEPVKTAYLFRLQPGGWKFERELGKNEKLNFDTGRIGKR